MLVLAPSALPRHRRFVGRISTFQSEQSRHDPGIGVHPAEVDQSAGSSAGAPSSSAMRSAAAGVITPDCWKIRRVIAIVEA